MSWRRFHGASRAPRAPCSSPPAGAGAAAAPAPGGRVPRHRGPHGLFERVAHERLAPHHDDDLLELGDVVLLRPQEDRLDVQGFLADREQRRVAADDFGPPPVPPREVLRDLRLLIDRRVRLLRADDERALGNLEHGQLPVVRRVLVDDRDAAQVQGLLGREDHHLGELHLRIRGGQDPPVSRITGYGSIENVMALPVSRIGPRTSSASSHMSSMLKKYMGSFMW